MVEQGGNGDCAFVQSVLHAGVCAGISLTSHDIFFLHDLEINEVHWEPSHTGHAAVIYRPRALPTRTAPSGLEYYRIL